MHHHDLARPTLAILAGSLAALLGTLALRVLMARSLTPAELGSLFAAIALVSWAGGVASLGLNAATAHRSAQALAVGDGDGARRGARTAMAVAAVSGLVATTLVGVAGWFAPAWLLPGHVAELLPGVAPTALGMACGLAAVGVSRAFGDVLTRSLLRDAGGGALRLVVVGSVILGGGSVAAVALGFAAASLAAELAAVAHTARRGWLSAVARPRWDHGLVAAIRPYAWLETLNQSLQWVDMVVVGALASPAEAGFYAVARGLSRALQMVQGSVGHAFLPAATDAWRDASSVGLRIVYGRARALVFALLWPALALCVFAPAAPVRVLFGEAYVPAETVLRILALALLLDSLLGAKELALIATDQPAVAARAGFWAFVVGAAALVTLTPRFGAAGAATALVAMAAARAAVSTRALRTRGDVRVWRDDIPPSVLAAVAVTSLAAVTAILLGAGTVGRAAVAVGTALVTGLWVVAGSRRGIGQAASRGWVDT